MDYNASHDVARGHPGFKNVVSNMPRMSHDEFVRNYWRPDSSEKPVVRLERESIALRKDLFHKFVKPGRLVSDSLMGTFSTTKACVVVEKDLHFFGRARNFQCL